MPTTYTPAAANANEDAFAGVAFDDPKVYASHDNKRVDSLYFLKPVQDELIALQAGRVASNSYRQTWTCVSGLNVGDPVYVSANDTVTLADATTSTKAQVIGFVRYKPTTTSCYIEHFRYVSGLSGGTAGGKVYLTDAGSFSASAGTVEKIVGQWITSTEALLNATQYTALSSGISGGTTSFVPKFASSSSLGLSAYGDDGTYGALMGIGSSTFNDASTLLKWRGTTIPASFTHASAGGTSILFRAQSAFASSGGNGADIVFMPGAKDGAGTDGKFIIRQPGGTAGANEIQFWHDGTNAVLTKADSGGSYQYRISSSTVLAVSQSVDSNTAASNASGNGFWTNQAYMLGQAGIAYDLATSRDSASIFRWSTTGLTDALTFCKISGSGTAPSAYTNAADTAGKDVIFRTQSGGTHSAANPRGGNFAVRLGAKGSGGSGNDGEFIVETTTGTDILGCRSDRINRQDFWNYVLPLPALTSDATPTTINTLALSDAYVYHIRARVVGVRTDGTVRESYEVLLTAYRTGGGGATIQDSTTVHAPAAPTWTVSVTTSGNNIIVQVTGSANDINWSSQFEYARLSE